MNGARALLSTLVDAGVDVCFANPGPRRCTSSPRSTTCPPCAVSSASSRASSRVPPTATGAWRAGRRPRCCTSDPGSATGWPTCTTPGEPGRRSSTSWATTPPTTPATTHRCSRTSRRSPPPSRGGTARRPGPTTWVPMRAEAVAAALGPPGCVATLVLPADASWSESATGPCPPRPQRPAGRRRRATRSMRWPRRCVAASGPHSSSVAAHCGPADCRRPAGWRPHRGRAPGRDLPRQPGARRGHPGGGPAGLPGRDGAGPTGRGPPPRPGRRQVARSPSSPTPTRRATWCPPGCTVHTLARPGEDAAGALEALAEAVGAPGDGGVPAAVGPPRSTHRCRHDGDAGGRRGRHAARGGHRGRRGQHRPASSSRERRRARPGTTG